MKERSDEMENTSPCTCSIFEQCIRHIRGLDKRGFRKLRRESVAMFGKDTRIVLPDDSDKSNRVI